MSGDERDRTDSPVMRYGNGRDEVVTSVVDIGEAPRLNLPAILLYRQLQ